MTTAAKPPRRSRTAPRGNGPVRAARETTSAATVHPQPSTLGEQLRAAREAKGYSVSLLSRLVARDIGTVSPESLRISISGYEAGAIDPTPERLEAIMTVLGQDAASQARAGVAAVLTTETLAELVGRHGGAAVGDALVSLGAMLRTVPAASIKREKPRHR